MRFFKRHFIERHEFVDLSPENVEVSIRSDGKVVWVFVDGETVLRCCRIGNLVVTDARNYVQD